MDNNNNFSLSYYIKGQTIVNTRDLAITDESEYVGNSVSLEAGYAHGLKHPIFCLNLISEPAVAYLCKYIKTIDELVTALEGTR